MPNRKRVLITGGAGFIGSNLAHYLLKKKYSVNIIDNLSNGERKNIPKNVRFLKGDITKINDLEKIVKNCNIIFHLAAKSALQETISEPNKCMSNNILGTANIINLCVKKKILLIFASTCAVYPLNKKKKFSENDYVGNATPYSISKLSSEFLINFYFKQKKLKGNILRFFNVYGNNQKANSEYSAVIPKFILAAKSNKNLLLNNNGKQTRDFIHVSDICRALHIASLKPINQTFNVGSGKETSIKELANEIIKQTGKGKIKKMKKINFDASFSCSNSKKIFRKLGFRYSIFLKDGLKGLINEK